MKIKMRVVSNFRGGAAKAKVKKAGGKALLKVVTKMAEQAKTPWPTGTPYLTGNNARSLDFDCDMAKLWATLFSTSGYGGFLEVGYDRGGRHFDPRPYMKPALDRYLPKFGEYMRGYL